MDKFLITVQIGFDPGVAADLGEALAAFEAKFEDDNDVYRYYISEVKRDDEEEEEDDN